MSSIIKDECVCATGSDDKATLKQYLLERKELMILYKNILEYMKIMPTEETLEVGKVKENSIYLPTKARIMSPHIKKVREGIVKANPTKERIEKMQTVWDIVSYNPYGLSEFQMMREIHDKTNKSISFGVFGKVYDQDKEYKEKIFKLFMESMKSAERPCKEEVIRVNDNFFYTVKSENRVLVKKQVR